jgi:hypothetical protein
MSDVLKFTVPVNDVDDSLNLKISGYVVGVNSVSSMDDRNLKGAILMPWNSIVRVGEI